LSQETVKDGFQVDKPLPLRYGVVYRLLVTSEDVIHSFSVPSLQIKMDAIPGRINSVFFVPDRYGSFVGYCSELCGVGHGYMPIVIEVIKVIIYLRPVKYESSLILCTSYEGYFYVCMCLMLLFGFFVLSIVMSIKTGYYR
uniref:cytochrome-c oxidase n=1 Tax=Schistocephalus solidus TaxID=70667 RepID=A0A183TRV9_SCHSO